ncbi:MAG TPA: hypothetical protein VJ343_00605 [archaeon]|nr:hypothetical protein [archaeon]
MPRKAKGMDTLYFIVRSWLMGLINSVMLLSIVYALGSINTIQTFIIGIFLFIITLFITRFFQKQINKTTYVVLRYLDKWKWLKNFILKYL